MVIGNKEDKATKLDKVYIVSVPLRGNGYRKSKESKAVLQLIEESRGTIAAFGKPV